MKKILCYVALVVVLVTINCTKEDQLLIPTRQDNQIDQRSVHFTLTHCPESDCRRVIPLENKQIDLYLSKQDFIHQKTPVHTIQTNEDGVANWSFLEFDSLYFAIHADLNRPENIPNDIVYTQDGTISYIDLSYNPSCIYDFYGKKVCDYNIDFQNPIVGQISRYAFWTANGYGTDNPTELEYTGDILQVELVEIDEYEYIILEEKLIRSENFDSSKFIGLILIDLDSTYTQTVFADENRCHSIEYHPDKNEFLNVISMLHFTSIPSIWSFVYGGSNFVESLETMEFNDYIPSELITNWEFFKLENQTILGKEYSNIYAYIQNKLTNEIYGKTKIYDQNKLIRSYNYAGQGIINGYDLIPS